MCGPSCVCNTDISGDILVAAIFYKIVNFSLSLKNVKVAVIVDESHSSAVVASVFKSSQSFDENGKRFFVSYISNNTTHNYIRLNLKIGCKFTVIFPFMQEKHGFFLSCS